MARCSQCNLLCSLEAEDPEVYYFSVSNTGDIIAQIHLVRSSACCGEPVQSQDFQFDETIQHDCAGGEEYDGENIDEPDFETTDEMNTRTKSGRRIKNPRFQARMIGVTSTFTAKCLTCGEEVEVKLSDNCKASEFEEL